MIYSRQDPAFTPRDVVEWWLGGRPWEARQLQRIVDAVAAAYQAELEFNAHAQQAEQQRLADLARLEKRQKKVGRQPGRDLTSILLERGLKQYYPALPLTTEGTETETDSAEPPTAPGT